MARPRVLEPLRAATEDAVILLGVLLAQAIALPFIAATWIRAALVALGVLRPAKLPAAVRQPRVILITGASCADPRPRGSNGIGEALAYEYAAPGVTLILTARRKDKLEGVAARCREAGATAEVGAIDVTDREAMKRFLLEQDDKHPIDLVIANAGVSASMLGDDATLEERARTLFAVNVDGFFNTIFPLIDRFRERRAGQIAGVSSLSEAAAAPGFMDRAHGVAYSASKAAVTTYLRSLRAALTSSDVRVSAICPGFVETALTGASHKYGRSTPLLMPATEAAKIIRDGLANDVAVIAFPLPTYFAAYVSSTLPSQFKSEVVAFISNAKNILWKHVG